MTDRNRTSMTIMKVHHGVILPGDGFGVPELLLYHEALAVCLVSCSPLSNRFISEKWNRHRGDVAVELDARCVS